MYMHPTHAGSYTHTNNAHTAEVLANEHSLNCMLGYFLEIIHLFRQKLTSKGFLLLKLFPLEHKDVKKTF